MPGLYFIFIGVCSIIKLICIGLPTINCNSILNPKQGRLILDNDFEEGSFNSWYDESTGRVYWDVEDFYQPFEVNQPAPKPTSGTKYLRARRNANLDSGSIFFTSEDFTAYPGDQVSFKFWIRSYFRENNELQVLTYILCEKWFLRNS